MSAQILRDTADGFPVRKEVILRLLWRGIVLFLQLPALRLHQMGCLSGKAKANSSSYFQGLGHPLSCRHVHVILSQKLIADLLNVAEGTCEDGALLSEDGKGFLRILGEQPHLGRGQLQSYSLV